MIGSRLCHRIRMRGERQLHHAEHRQDQHREQDSELRRNQAPFTLWMQSPPGQSEKSGMSGVGALETVSLA
jgi:hypothetical protein